MKKYVRFCYQNKIVYGILEGELIRILSGSCPEEFEESGRKIMLNQVKLLAPCQPTKIVGTGLNYKDISLEPGETLPEKPRLFIKPPTTVITHGQDVIQPPMVKELYGEVELAVVIGKTAKCVRESHALDYVWGYTVANDMTASDLQREDTLWGRAKSFDTFLPLAPVLVSGIQPKGLHLSTTINGQPGQSGSTDDMLCSVPWLVSYISHIMTLLPGDIIITGTPTGYGTPLKIGDVVTTEIREIGSMTNRIAAMDDPYYFNELKEERQQ